MRLNKIEFNLIQLTWLTQDFGRNRDLSYIMDDNNRSYRRFEAILQLGYEMGGQWPRLTRILDVLIPNLLGNSVYSLLWSVRKIFGTDEQYILPTKSMRARMLENIE